MTQHEVVKHRGNTLSTKNKRSLLTLTDAILKTATTARQSNELIIDDSWIDRIWAWADNFELSEKLIPRNREDLLAETTLGILGGSGTMFKSFYIPNEIVNLTNLKTIEIYGGKLKKLPDNIGELTNLTMLYILDSEIKVLPE